MNGLNGRRLRALRRRLLAHYDEYRRDLPWRRTRDPYAIWISEVMLQQTRVETVIPYYRRFLRHFPNVRALANAKEERVLALWAGLGYYGRARNLLRAARRIEGEHRGKLPQHYTELSSLPGFGPYTTAALCSIAYGEAVAAVDGNARRVISRLFATHEQLPALAQQLLDPDRPGDHNQAIMELGAKICLPKNPRCVLCPLRGLCRAARSGQLRHFPRRPVKVRRKRLYVSAVVLQEDGKLFLRRRPTNGLWAGMWEFPTQEATRRVSRQSFFRHLRAHYKLVSRRGRFVGSFKHVLTHRDVEIDVYTAAVKRGGAKVEGGRWIRRCELQRQGLSSLQRRVAELALP